MPIVRVGPPVAAESAPRRSRRRTLLAAVLVVVVGAAVAVLAHGALPSVIGGEGPWRSGGAPRPSVPPLTLEASSSLGRELSVTYDGARGPVRPSAGTAGSWSATVATGAGTGTRTLTVASHASTRSFLAGVDLRSDIVTCRVIDATGTVVVERRATGQNASVSCTGY